MARGQHTDQIKRIRNEILIALKIVYPGALKATHIMRGLLALFPQLEFDYLKRDLHYLLAKGYITRVFTEFENESAETPWRQRWFRLSTSGMEVADNCINDPAIQS